jgi:DNA-binding NarL/FixJ family response regulator
MPERLRILIADDHPLFRKGLRTLLATLSHVTVVGEAANGGQALTLVESLRPDLVLMDLQMPDGDGLSAIRQIAATHPQTAILVVTMFEDADSVFAALRAGARGYVLKDMDDDEMVRAIQAVGHGEAIFSPAIATRILTYFSGRPAQPPQPFPDLTESERKVLRLMARGLVNDAIAVELGFTTKTVRNYVSSIFSKLHVADRAQAIIKARDAGLGG